MTPVLPVAIGTAVLLYVLARLIRSQVQPQGRHHVARPYRLDLVVTQQIIQRVQTVSQPPAAFFADMADFDPEWVARARSWTATSSRALAEAAADDAARFSEIRAELRALYERTCLTTERDQ